MEPEEIKDLTPLVPENNELNAAAEFKGNKEDEEDLLLTAQRYLNIFHQIHIFKEFRKKQFDKELMNIPQEIRKVIALLPGGRILLEHIAELLQEAGKNDPALDNLLTSLASNDHFSDNKISVNHQPSPMLESAVSVSALTPQVINAPIELSDNFTKTLTDSFQAYSHNLEALTENIQKMVLKVPTSAPASNAIGNEVATALTSSFNAYSENLKELTESIQKLIINHPTTATVSPSIEISSEFTKALTDSFGTYSHNLEALTSSIQQLAQNHPQVTNTGAPTSIEIGNEFAKVLTDSFGNFAHNLEELTVSVQKIAIPQSPQPLEISDKFASVLNDSLTTYSQNLQDLKTSIQLIASAATNQKTTKATETSVPNFADSIATILKENAQQQMNILKSFGETLSKTIADSQKELITSIKSSQKNSMIIGKFLQVPSEESTAVQEQIITPESAASENKGPKSAFSTVQLLSSASSENVNQAPISNSGKSAFQTGDLLQNKVRKANKNQTISEADNKKTFNKNANLSVNQKQSDIKTAADKKTKSADNKQQTNTLNSNPSEPISDHKENSASDQISTTAANTSEDIDINDIFAQMSSSLTNDDLLSESTAETEFDDTFVNAFTESDKPAVVQPQTPEKQYKDAVFQIRDALYSDNQISLDDVDTSPVSLSPNDNLTDSFNTSLTGELPENNSTQSAENNSIQSAENNNDVLSDETEWEYEYVDEEGNPITPSGDDDWEYEYVEEDNSDNSDNSSDETEWEYEYVDEEGNQITPSGDDDWEYVDENGNPINS